MQAMAPPDQINLDHWETLFERQVLRSFEGIQIDSAHDVDHFRRVAATARLLTSAEKGRIEVVLPAAWLHDLVYIPKNDPRRTQASRLSGQAAVDFLSGVGYPTDLMEDVQHAIEAHSFSARIEARTLEARIVQDADRLDGIGAIGIARCFSLGAQLGRPFYEHTDPFATERALDDTRYTLDHFYVKLLKTAETLTTPAGRVEGHRRAETMRLFLAEFRRELRAQQG